MVTVRDVDAKKFIKAAKGRLKKFDEIEPPEWSLYAKSGSNRKRPPEQPDFWFIRGSAILRRIYLDGPIGVERLRNFYGGRKRRRTKPARFKKASGSIIRKLLQQLEDAGLVKKKGSKGRIMTPEGRKLVDNISNKVAKEGSKED